MLGEYFKIAWNNLKHRKLRSWLTMIGIFVGIAAVVALIAIGQGLEKSIQDQFEELGTDKIVIQPKSAFASPGAETAVQLTEDDVDAVEKTKGVVEAIGMIYRPVKLEYNDELIFQYVVGFDPETRLFEEFQSFDILEGRNIKKGDSKKVALGYFYSTNRIFEKPVKVREKLLINGEEFKVIGIYTKVGNPSDDSQIYMTTDAARELLGLEDEVDWIMARVGQGQNTEEIAESVKKNLRKKRDLEKGKEDFVVQTFEELLKSVQTILGIVQVILLGIAAISLLVGSIGIMNTMYTSVLQRTQEIGILKSIGARNSTIAWLFLIESGLLGFFGGIIGIILGILIAKAVEFAAAGYGLGILKISFPWYLMLGALLFSFLIGTLSGVFPAIRASKQSVVDSLRYE